MKLETLLRYYHDLPELPKALMRLKALLWFEPSVDGLRIGLHRLPYLFPNKHEMLSLTDFNTYVAFLKSEYFLDKEGVIRSALIHPVTLETLACEHAKMYVKTVWKLSELMGARLYKSGLQKNIEANALRLKHLCPPESSLWCC